MHHMMTHKMTHGKVHSETAAQVARTGSKQDLGTHPEALRSRRSLLRVQLCRHTCVTTKARQDGCHWGRAWEEAR
jgi:hypothetical protein